MSLHPSTSGLPIAKTYYFADPASDDSDVTWYATLVQELSAGLTAVSTLQIDQAVDFYWVATTLQADEDGIALTESTLITPMVNVVVQDNASRKNLNNITLPVGSLGGPGERPYRLIAPRKILANSTLSFAWTALAGAPEYTNLYLVLHGYTRPGS